MESYPVAFVGLMCTLFGLQTVVGIVCNLVILIFWYLERQKRSHTRGPRGSNFVTLMKILDLWICLTAIPVCLLSLILKKENNLALCFIKEGLIMFASTSSLVCIMLVSLDRYTAVVRPTAHVFTHGRVRVCRVVVVVSAGVGSLLPLFSFLMGSYSQAKVDSTEILHCRYVVWVFKPYYFYDFYYVILFIATIFIVFICYSAVLKAAKKRLAPRINLLQVPNTGKSASDAGKRRLESKATRMTLAIIVCFIVCWGPHVIVTLLQFGLPGSLEIDMIQTCCLFLAFLSPVLHPFIYTYEGKRHTKTNTIGSAEISQCGTFRKTELNRLNSVPISPSSADFLSSADSFTFNSTATYATSTV